MSTVLYLKIEQKTEVDHPQVLLKDIAKMECTRRECLNRLKTEKILSAEPGKDGRYVFSVLAIIEKIHEIYPELEVQNLGETDFIIHYKVKKTAPWLTAIKVGALVLVTFLGSAFSIMTFQEDISAGDLFDKVYQSVLGSRPEGMILLEIFYAIGLTLGVVIFFNHMGSTYFTKDPTPISVEMKSYEKQVNTTVIDTASRKDSEIDVD